MLNTKYKIQNAGSRTRAGNLWFPGASRWPPGCAPYSLGSSVIGLFNLYFISGACGYSSYSLGRWAGCVGVPGGGCGGCGDLFFWDWRGVSGGSLLGLA